MASMACPTAISLRRTNAGGGALYLLLGDLQEAVILLAYATLSVGITIVRETRTERVL